MSPSGFWALGGGCQIELFCLFRTAAEPHRRPSLEQARQSFLPAGCTWGTYVLLLRISSRCCMPDAWHCTPWTTHADHWPPSSLFADPPCRFYSLLNGANTLQTHQHTAPSKTEEQNDSESFCSSVLRLLFVLPPLVLFCSSAGQIIMMQPCMNDALTQPSVPNRFKACPRILHVHRAPYFSENRQSWDPKFVSGLHEPDGPPNSSEGFF
jgi:hypothetical protein